MRRGPGIGDLTLIFRYEKNIFIYWQCTFFTVPSLCYIFRPDQAAALIFILSFNKTFILFISITFFPQFLWQRRAPRSSFLWRTFLPFQGVLELEPDTSLIEERVRGSVKGVLPCDLSTEGVFPEGVHFAPVEVLICSLGDTFLRITLRHFSL